MPRTARAAQVVEVARRILEADGREALTMRRLAADLEIRAPSLYKHFASKAEVEGAVTTDVFAEVGALLHRVVAEAGEGQAVADLLAAYRCYALVHPQLYRLVTAGPLDREWLPAGLEEWAGEPFFLVTGEPYRAQALWAAAHGLAVLEIDDRYLPGSELDRTWAVTAAIHAMGQDRGP